MFALIAAAARAFGPPVANASGFHTTVTCPTSGTLLSECQYGCADTAAPTTTDCAYTYCREMNDPVSVDMAIDDTAFLPTSTINNQHAEFCGCWLGTNTQTGAFEAMSIREVDGTTCTGDVTTPWNSALFDQTYPGHFMDTNVTRLCAQCSPAPTTTTTTGTITTTTTSTTTLRSCPDVTRYVWPAEIFASQTGCLLQIHRDGAQTKPWPAPFRQWFVGHSASGVASLTGRGSSVAATLSHNLSFAFVPPQVGPLQLAEYTPTPTQAPTPPAAHVCGTDEVGLYYDGEQTAKLACNLWQPSFCRHRPDAEQCQCYCGVPAVNDLEDEVVGAAVWSVIGANSAVFMISVSCAFKKIHA